jgi:hypothetical protein
MQYQRVRTLARVSSECALSLMIGCSTPFARVRGDSDMDSQSRSTEATRNFDLRSIPGLSYKARAAVNAAFEAMSTWRSELADNSEKNIRQVIEKMAAAAAELGWPEQVIDAARTQMQSITEAQIKAVDQIMNAWEEQLKWQNSTALSTMPQGPKFSHNSGWPGSWPGADAFQMGATNPVQFWMQVAGQWQKSWTDMLTFWIKASPYNTGLPHH